MLDGFETELMAAEPHFSVAVPAQRAKSKGVSLDSNAVTEKGAKLDELPQEIGRAHV